MPNPSSTLPIIPLPRQSTVLSGAFALQPETRLLADPAVEREAACLASILRRATGFPCEVRPAGGPPAARAHDIVLRLDPKAAGGAGEGYALMAPPDEPLAIRAAAPAGMARGIQTLLQLLPPAILGAGPRPRIDWTLPRVAVEDAPRFAWRGAMLDCARHFMPPEFIRKFIDLLALHKLNTFHWHLTDDQGWRIEIKRYPKLTEVGSRRKESTRGHLQAKAGGDGIPHGGFYSQEDIRSIVAYAAERHITIVPEIDLPGHCQAVVAAYPELGCVAEPVEVGTAWGIHPYVLNLRESTLRFLQDVLAEVTDLFPGPYVHIGGDEVVRTQWEASEETRARMAELGIADCGHIQSWFLVRAGEFLASRGRRLIGWDEILDAGNLAPETAVMSWRGTQPGLAAARAGHDVVMAPKDFTYFDYYQSAAPSEEPLAIGGCLPLENVYAYEPVPADLDEPVARRILGLQGQHWTEYMPTPAHVEYMAFPRLCALAEVGWSPPGARDFQDFRARLDRHLRRLAVLGVRYRPPG